jgi:ATP-dependent Lhr-like helicase
LTRDDLVQSAAAIRAVRRGELDKLTVVKQPRDILAQQMVATVASWDSSANIPMRQGRDRSRFGVGELTAKSAKDAKKSGDEGIGEEALWQLIRGAYPYEDLSREEFDQILEMLCEGVETRKSRRSAYIHRDRINGMLRPRRGARLTAITNGGRDSRHSGLSGDRIPERNLRWHGA